MHDQKPPNSPLWNNPGSPVRDAAYAEGIDPDCGATAHDAAASAPGASDSADLNVQLQSALAESAQTKDALLRALADAENMRRRATADVVNAHKYAIEGFAANLLAVKDTLEMALADKTSTIEQLRMGVDLTLKNLATAFEKAKISDINPLNQKFDPSLHQAVSHIDSEQPPNTVVQVFQKGYLLQDRVLRPAMVAVAKGGATAPAQGNDPVETRGY